MNSVWEPAWDRVLETLKEKTNSHNFNLWFKPIKVTDVTDEAWTLTVPNGFLRDWITDNYSDILERSLYEVLQKHVKIDIRIDASSQVINEPVPPRAKPIRKTRKKAAPQLGQMLNPKFVFDRFVVGKGNEFANAACQAVATQPGSAYNPLFIYGGTGLGKTHLLQAVGHLAQKKNPDLKIAYLTSERFISELINAIKSNDMAEFKRRYRDRCDILLMDDIQFIAGKTSTQEEFFHTFNFLFESGKQIVVTSDQYPQEIKSLDERIRSRLQSGLVADIKAPDIETRMAILTKKAELDGFQIESDVINFLAKNIKSNVREMEGSLIRLEAFASLTGTTISLPIAKDILKDVIGVAGSVPDCDNIQKKVCSYFKIKVKEMLSRSRKRTVLIPRQIAMYLVKEYTDLSLSEIGSRFGGKDHTTVMSSLNRIEQLMVDDMGIRNNIEALEKQLELR